MTDLSLCIWVQNGDKFPELVHLKACHFKTFQKVCCNSTLTFNALPLVCYRNAWYEDGRLLLIIITFCVVVPLAMLPKIGEFPNEKKCCFSISDWFESLRLPGCVSLSHQRIPGLHQQPCLHLHVVFYSCGEFWPKPWKICWLHFFQCWLVPLLSCF